MDFFSNKDLIRIVLVFIMLINIPVFSQKILEREIDAKTIQSLEINSDIINQIDFISNNSSTIKVTVRIEGEYSEHIVLSVFEEDHKLLLSPEYSPIFEADNDKLAAHKVQAIDLKISVPDYLTIQVRSKLATVNAKGNYKSISAYLENGNCIIKSFRGNAHIKTLKGFITIETNEMIHAEATSKKGKVVNELIKNKNAKYFINAESYEGDISLFNIH